MTTTLQFHILYERQVERMWKPTIKTIDVTLKNNLSVKGSYKYSLRGCYFDFYVLSPNGRIIATQTFSNKDFITAASDTLKAGIDQLATILVTYKLDELVSEKALAAIVPAVIKKAFIRQVFDSLKVA